MSLEIGSFPISIEFSVIDKGSQLETDISRGSVHLRSQSNFQLLTKGLDRSWDISRGSLLLKKVG